MSKKLTIFDASNLLYAKDWITRFKVELNKAGGSSDHLLSNIPPELIYTLSRNNLHIVYAGSDDARTENILANAKIISEVVNDYLSEVKDTPTY